MSIRVLIVDDEIDLPHTIRAFLEDETDFEIMIAFSGEEGLEMIEKAIPDVCIVDIRLPGINGNEFILQVHEKFRECKFIVHTGSIGYSVPQELKQTGITQEFVIGKPVMDMTVFHEKILKLLRP